MLFFCCEYDLSRSTKEKSNTYLTNLSEKGLFSSQRQIVTGITYRAKSEKSKNNSKKTYENSYLCYEYDISISTRQKTIIYSKNLSENGHFSNQRQIVTGITSEILKIRIIYPNLSVKVSDHINFKSLLILMNLD